MNSNIVVIKYGGAAMQSDGLMQTTVDDILYLSSLGLSPVVVHGGGPDISKLCEKLGILPSFVNGLRVTDKETLAIAQMILIGKVNKELVACINQVHGKAVGISGLDGNLLMAKQEDPSLGFVGAIEKVNPAIIHTLIGANYIPVIAPIATSSDLQNYNVNADNAAAAIAAALQASHLFLLTDVPGILIHSTKIDKLHCADIPDLIQDGIVRGGMVPKVAAAAAACQKGVGQVHILDGRQPHALLSHLQGLQSLGTTIYV